jgi:hypothetical protein
MLYEQLRRHNVTRQRQQMVMVGEIAAQSVARTSEDLDALLHNAPGRPRVSDEAMALLLALFLVGHAVADGAHRLQAIP